MKPYHLMTPAERTAQRIAQNRAMDQKIESDRTVAETKRRERVAHDRAVRREVTRFWNSLSNEGKVDFMSLTIRRLGRN
jgi:hypothetical protein